MATAARTRVRVKGTDNYLPTYQAKREAAYDGGSTGRRVRNFMPQSGGINRLVLGSLQLQRDRARDLARKVPWIESGIDKIVNNVVGTGIKVMPNYTNDNFKKSASRLYADWTQECDADGITDFDGLQALALRSVVEAGEVFIRIRKRRTTDGLTVPMQLQILEAEYVPIDKTETLRNGRHIKAGIEFDRLGRRIAYHMYREHPGDILTGMSNLSTVRIPANEVLHIYDIKRPGQIRGIPWMTPVVTRVRDLLEYEDAELTRKKTAAMYTAFITKNDEDDYNEGDDEDEEYDDEGVPETQLEAGTVQILEAGEDVAFSTPADVGGNYEVFMKMQLRAIAAGIGVTYEQLTGSLEDVNFSSIRAGLLEFQARAKRIQRFLIFQLCQPVWKEFVKQAVIFSGLIAPGFGSNPKKFLKAKWKPPGFRYVNPVQEVNAIKTQIRSGLITRAEAVAELGGDIEEIDNIQAEDNSRADGLGLVYDSDPRKTTMSGGSNEKDMSSSDDDDTKKPNKAGG
ncbi:phage portal protein [uncultured Kiloniella sp.]|uniref:phage portal protein n=1 Tax=uncultured Kiloniella sp. TaxID=1133091 RepID=UPI002639F532|nr:phage portal protein [uncultured Kiloniella sp.]